MQWSLEEIYKKQVRGKIPPRRHLNVLGEENTEQENPEQAEEEIIENNTELANGQNTPEEEPVEVETILVKVLLNGELKDFDVPIKISEEKLVETLGLEAWEGERQLSLFIKGKTSMPLIIQYPPSSETMISFVPEGE